MPISLKSQDRVYIRTIEGVKLRMSQNDDGLTIEALPGEKETTSTIINVISDSSSLIRITFSIIENKKKRGRKKREL